MSSALPFAPAGLEASPASASVASAPEAQRAWAALPSTERLAVIARTRALIAGRGMDFAAAIAPGLTRTPADTLAAEVWPLLDACRFLERNAARLLRPRKLGRAGRPWWLSGVHAEVRREPLGHILILAPANFPLFLPGVQALQALVAGNRVTWKPGTGGARVAHLLAQILEQAGLPSGLLHITHDSAEAGEAALTAGADKVVLTGSAATGRTVLAALAPSATPAVMELSGCDAVFVLPGADLAHTARAIAFGLRLNGSAVCMAPRRIIADARTLAALEPALHRELATIAPVPLAPAPAANLRALVDSAISAGAQLHGQLDPDAQRPLVLTQATADMAITRADIFAPVVSLLAADSPDQAAAIHRACPYGLTASIFCGPSDLPAAKQLAARLTVGTILINDLIAPTADPRLPFGGRGHSGFGVTRGPEGLLEMTAVKTIITRRGGKARHLDTPQPNDAAALNALIVATHGSSLRTRWAALRHLTSLSRNKTNGV